MRNSIALAKDYGGKRKWTMGYDNRVFTTTLTEEAIERLKADPRVHKVVETREKARISGVFPAKVDNTPSTTGQIYYSFFDPKPALQSRGRERGLGRHQTSPFLCLGQE